MTVYLVIDEEIDLMVQCESPEGRKELGKLMRSVSLQAVNEALKGLFKFQVKVP